MSRFDTKFMIVDGTTESLDEFSRDRQAFISQRVQVAAGSGSPVARGGPLSPEEQRALTELDVGTLDEMGSHPYMIPHFARAVEVDFAGIPFPDFDPAYQEAVTPHSYPNFAA